MALGLTVQRQEQNFGAIELDVARRAACRLPPVPPVMPDVRPDQPQVIKPDS